MVIQHFITMDLGAVNDYEANSNTAIGSKTLFSNTTGFVNTAIGAKALYSNTGGTSNTAIGFQSMYSNISGSANTAIGNQSLYSNNGSYNTALGERALYLNSGSDNTAIGSLSLFANSGFGNAACGNYALYGNTSGSYNTAIGWSALESNNAGENNTACGAQALSSNTGNNNTAVGYWALDANQNGYNNTAVGHQSLNWNSTGSNNSALGQGALFNSTGTWMTGLGHSADASAGVTNSTVIGDAAVVNASNKVRIGDGSMTVIEGQVAWSYPSDGRFKLNITEDVKGLDFIKLLRPVVYNFDTRKYTEFLTQNMPDSLQNEYLKKDFGPSTAMRQSGFVAQEVVEAANRVGYDFNGVHVPENADDNYSIAYSQFVVPLVKAVQEQQAMIEKLQKEIEELKAEK